VVQLVRVLCLAPVLGAWGYFYEVARVRNAAELEAARAAAQQASDAKGRLLAKVSHEIRTPLNGVLGLTQALLLQPLPGPVMGDLRLIQQSGTGLLVLINDLLDIARAEAGKIELHPTPVELGQLLTDLAALHRSSAQLKRLDLRVEWKTDAPCWVRADELRLRQIIGNLVSNAIKFTQSGEVVLRLGVGPETAGLTQTTFSIQDSGVGLDSQAIPQLFQPFRQFHTATGGSGLGLAISQELAKCMGGRLTVTSEQGTGSIFSLHLPLARATPPTSTIDTPERLDPFHALVVDDNQINRRVAQAFVTLLGGFSVGAVDGVEALRLAAGGSFDLILMDLQMPNLDGLQATARLREVGLIMPVLGLTAAVGPETLPACLKAGMVNCLSKPLDLSTLRAELRRHLGGRLQWPEDGPAAPRVRDAAAHGRISKVEEEGFTEEGDAPDRGAGHHRGCDRHCARKAVRRRKLRHVRGAREG
jgi:CheY-like chemotaxis protein